jgi:DNA-binding CsgD family transcriptional regulator
MLPAPEQSKIFTQFSLSTSSVLVNDRVSFQTEDDQCVIYVQGVIFAHYSREDRCAEAYAVVKLYESGYADQNDLARCFGYSTRTLRRYQQRLESGGLSALARQGGRPAAGSAGSAALSARDRTILRLKTQDMSNRWIAARLGLSETAVRKILSRVGWNIPPQPAATLFPETDLPPTPGMVSNDSSRSEMLAVPASRPPVREVEPGSVAKQVPGQSLDCNPLDRSMDRLMAALGLLEDAAPLFAPASNLPRAGVLLAVPVLLASGLLPAAEKIYGSLGPAFYGLRTTMVACVLLALLRIPRPEVLKEHSPGALGRIVGLDRMPEVKTLRRKLTRLAAARGSYQLGQEIARRRIQQRGRVMGFLYIDGHVRAYHGKHTIPKAYVTRARLAAPATTDYWVNDKCGDPVFVVTAEANASLTRMLAIVLAEVRQLVGPKRQVTVVFDRGGWSPKLFCKLLAAKFDVLTYRKFRTRQISEARFRHHRAKLDGRKIEYLLHDQAVRFLKGKLRLRQVTRLGAHSHQTPIITSRWDLPAIVVAYRMFERWRQENFFKYIKAEYLIDALADYQIEPDDPNRSVPNPARKALEKEMRRTRSKLEKLRARYAETSLASRSRRRRQTKTKEQPPVLRAAIKKIQSRLKKLQTQHRGLPPRLPLAQARKGQVLVKLATERKHLTNVLKMAAYNIESDLLQLIRPHYKRAEDEGRTFIQTALQDAADLEPSSEELHIHLAPLSSPHRTRVMGALCAALNRTNSKFPGSELRMRYSVASSP